MQQAYLQAVETESGEIKVVIKGKCAKCGTTRTPQWREGPEGPKTLCNACGVRLSREKKTKWGKLPKRKKAPQKHASSCQPPASPRCQPPAEIRRRSRAASPQSEQEDVSTVEAATDASDSLSQEINAAVQLLSMSFHSRSQRKASNGNTQGQKFQFISGRPDWRGTPFEQIFRSWSCLPDWRKGELWPMRSKLQTAWWEVEAAEAAVAAVAEVLAARTAAAVEAQLQFKNLMRGWEQACSSTGRDEDRPSKRGRTASDV